MSLAYELTDDKENLFIRLPKGSIDQKALEKLLDYIELETIRRRSQLTEQNATSLAKDITNSSWQEVKGLFKN